ncbi:MAG: carboxypeptidase-like regulatory domain-containing protein, partial [Crocinitomicaceae bacterium]|nr:carboxypeptidase-like regulatory domain-containing protein [Crocinitomicaceae bacterium]
MISIYSQQTIIKGKITEASTGQGIAFAKIRFLNSKIGTLTDSLGNYSLQTYYATDSLYFFFPGYKPVTKKIKKDQEQIINIQLQVMTTDIKQVDIRPPDELPSTRLHKLVVANKYINNKEKLDAYEYELYNKIQLDLN